MSTANQSNDSPIVAGWREWIALPELGIPGLKAKIDTGARSSALHTYDFAIEDGANGPVVVFNVHPRPRLPGLVIACRAPVVDFRIVSDSGGHRERRPFIRTRLRLGPAEWEIEMSLTNRETMRFRMLLGRSALAGRVRVEPGESMLHGRALAAVYRRGPRGAFTPIPESDP